MDGRYESEVCAVAEDIRELAGQVQHLDSRVTVLETKEPILQQMLERSITTNEKLSETMHKVQEAMISLGNKIDVQSTTIENIKHEIEDVADKTKARFNEFDKRVENIEEKGKFDITGYIKSHFPWIIIVLGLGIAYASQYFKV